VCIPEHSSILYGFSVLYEKFHPILIYIHSYGFSVNGCIHNHSSILYGFSVLYEKFHPIPIYIHSYGFSVNGCIHNHSSILYGFSVLYDEFHRVVYGFSDQLTRYHDLKLCSSYTVQKIVAKVGTLALLFHQFIFRPPLNTHYTTSKEALFTSIIYLEGRCPKH
jgi:hypothetical protein